MLPIKSLVIFRFQYTNIGQVPVYFCKVHSVTHYKIIWTLQKKKKKKKKYKSIHLVIRP